MCPRYCPLLVRSRADTTPNHCQNTLSFATSCAPRGRSICLKLVSMNTGDSARGALGTRRERMCKTGYASGFALGDLITPLAVVGLLLCIGGFIHQHYFAGEATAAETQARELLDELSSDLERSDAFAEDQVSSRRRTVTARREIPLSVPAPGSTDGKAFVSDHSASNRPADSAQGAAKSRDSMKDTDSRTVAGNDAKLRARWSSQAASSPRRAASRGTADTRGRTREAEKISRRKIDQIARRQNDRWNAIMDEDM